MRRSFLLSLAPCLVLPALPALPLAAQTPAPSPDPVPRTAETAVTPVNRNPARHAQFLHRIKEGRIDLLFLGGSIMDFWPKVGEWTWLKFAPYNPADFGVSGDCTEDMLWRITNGELDGIAPKVTVLMIGTNNLGQHKDEKPAWAAAGIEKIVATIHEKLPETKLLLLAVFPRSGAVLRGEIDAVNAQIARLDDGKTTRYLDLGHVFLDEHNQIPHDVMPDGLHPSAKGYDLWYDAMKPTLDGMMK